MDDERVQAAQPTGRRDHPGGETERPPVMHHDSPSGPSREDAQQPAGADHRYAQEIDLDSESTHARVVRLAGNDRRVLELGPATGHMSRALTEHGCSVIGIEVNPAMAAKAARYCERVVVGDLDELDLDSELGDDRFEVILAADVLEHLKDPLAALKQLRGFLAPDGFFVISLPNIAHGSVRLALLEGHFSYRNTGLLDATHLRFFTRESIDELLDRAELGAAEIYHQELNIDASEVSFDPDAAPPGMLETLQHDPDARTYQFVIKAIPFETNGLREVQRRMRELAHENARLREELHVARSQDSGREGELRIALINAHDQMLRRDEQTHHLQQDMRALREANEAAQAEIAHHREQASFHREQAAFQRDQALRVRVRLERILSSPPARAYTKLGNLPGLKSLVSARTAGYDTAMRSAQATEINSEHPDG